MDIIENLKTFIAVVETGNFTGASRKLKVAVSVVKKRMDQLEAKAGVQLFERSTRSMTLTDAGRRHLLVREIRRRQTDIAVSPFVQLEPAGAPAGAHDLPFMRHVDEEIRRSSTRTPHRRVAGSHDPDPFEEPHTAVKLEAEVRHGGGTNRLELLNPLGGNVGSQLPRHAGLPARRIPLEVERRPFALQPVLESEIQGRGLAGVPVPHDGLRLARIVIAVVQEKHDFTTDLSLHPARRLELGVQEASREETTRLLAEADDRSGTHADAPSPAWRGRTACKTSASSTQDAQPIRLYQR